MSKYGPEITLISNENKLFNIILEAVRDECVKVSKEEIISSDEQIIYSKTKFSKARQYNAAKSKT